MEVRAPWSADWTAFVWSSVPGVALAAAATAGWVPESVAMPLFALSFVGFNLMHMGATWARVYVRPGWQTRPVERLAIPIALVIFALSFEAIGGGALLLAAQYFLSFHHALMQNYGILRTSQRRTGRNLDVRLDLAACLLLPSAALLYRASAVCHEYAGAALPAISIALVQTMAFAGAVALVAFVWREWRAHRNGERVDPLGIGILCGTNLLWSGILVASPHPAYPLYALASGHYAQYLYFVWHAEQRDPAVASTLPLAPQLQATMHASRLQYLLVLLLMAGSLTLLLTFVSAGLRGVATALELRPDHALAIPAWAAAMLGINLEHYWLDHRIWRRSRRPAVSVAEAA